MSSERAALQSARSIATLSDSAHQEVLAGKTVRMKSTDSEMWPTCADLSSYHVLMLVNIEPSRKVIRSTLTFTCNIINIFPASTASNSVAKILVSYMYNIILYQQPQARISFQNAIGCMRLHLTRSLAFFFFSCNKEIT